MLLRVYENFAGSAPPDPLTAGRPSTRIDRRRSADGGSGPVQERGRQPLPSPPPLQSLEAFARLGSMKATKEAEP